MKKRTSYVVAIATGLALFHAAIPCRSEVMLADLGGQVDFDWTCCGFSQRAFPEHVRLSSQDGWGVANLSLGSIDLTDNLDQFLSVRMRPEMLNTAEHFTLAVVDETGAEAKWLFEVAGRANPGEWSTLAARESLANPTHGTGNWQNIDMADIRDLRVLGHFNHPDPFVMSFDTVGLIEHEVGYPGRSADAAWRGEAAERIEQLRMGEINLRVVDPQGRPVAGAEVGLQMQEHAFGFGSAVQAYRLRDNNPAHRAYKQHVAELFNAATIENNLKWPAWEGQWGNNFTKQGALQAAEWLNQNGISVRGHNVIWPGASHLPASLASFISRPNLSDAQLEGLRGAISERIEDVVGTMAGSLTAWDVINEPRANHDLMDVLPEGNLAMVDWFVQAREHDPEAKLFLNDFGIITSGGNVNSPNQRNYYETIEFLQENGAPIDGVSFQGHFRKGSLTGPAELWQIFDRFSQLGLSMQVTEFDFATDDEQLQADYTRDFLTAAFAHPGLDDVLIWGFWENAHWRPEAAMFRSDWSIKPNGEAYRELVFDEWWTDEHGVVDAAGETSFRAFKGLHEITVVAGHRLVTDFVTLDDESLLLEVTLPYEANFDADGAVDRDDLNAVLNNFGSVEPNVIAGDTDNDGDTDGHDLLTALLQFGAAGQTPGIRVIDAAANAQAVPEPATLAIAGALVLCWLTPCFSARRQRDWG